jgi:serine/threonine protein kinase
VITLWYRPPEILLGQKAYALPTDMWSIGAIIAEMSNKRPLFPGDSEIDEIYKIFRLLGTPTEKTWPGVTDLPDWNPRFPSWDPREIAQYLPRLPEQGIDLVKV